MPVIRTKNKIISLILVFSVLIGSISFISSNSAVSAESGSAISGGLYLFGRNGLAADSDGENLVYAYDALVKGIGEYQTEIPVNEGNHQVPRERYGDIIEAVRNDHPEFFWFESSKYYYSGDYVSSVLPNYSFTEQELTAARDEMSKAVSCFTYGISPDASDYEISRIIHDRLILFNDYDLNGTYAHSSYGGLVKGNIVCEGYARAYQLLLNYMGISCTTVTGTGHHNAGDSGEAHAWNLSVINGNYVYTDVTWDDTSYGISYGYFNIGEDLPNHIRNDRYYIPECTETETENWYYNTVTGYDFTDIEFSGNTMDYVSAYCDFGGIPLYYFAVYDKMSLQSTILNNFYGWFQNREVFGKFVENAGLKYGTSYGAIAVFNGFNSMIYISEYSENPPTYTVYINDIAVATSSPYNWVEVSFYSDMSDFDTTDSFIWTGNKDWSEIRGQDRYYPVVNFVMPDHDVRLYTGSACSDGHRYEAVETVDPTCTEQGYTRYVCSVCGTEHYEYTEPVGHDYIPTVTAPTCTDRGYTTYVCPRCGDTYVGDYTEPTGHDWNDGTVTTEPTCTEPGVRTFTCQNDPSHTYTEVIEALGHDYIPTVTAPTCTDRGYTTYVCSRCGDTYVGDYTEPAGHDWDDGTVTTEPSCTETGIMTFTCKKDPSHTYTEVIEALGHEYIPTVTAPTCTERGYTTYVCSRCGDTYVGDYTEPTGHDWGEWTTVTEPTETEEGLERRVCGNDPSHVEERVMPALNHKHTMQHFDAKDATCEEDGNIEYYVCTDCGKYYYDDLGERELSDPGDVIIKAKGHTYTDTVTAPTCTEGGYTTHTCTVCGYSYTDNETEPLGHNWGNATYIWSDDNSTVTAEVRCLNDETHVQTEKVKTVYEVITAPTLSQNGSARYTASFENGMFEQQTKEVALAKLSMPFTDVKAGEYYELAVLWAVENGVTSGTSATTFSPNGKCTRGQIATFLWRAAGEPDPGNVTNPFKDVKESDYFYKAVLWAVENDITKGTSKTTFSPNDTCTRGQIVTFLYRAKGSPETDTVSSNPFKDVKSSQYYYDAVLWAVENGITKGTSDTTFSPNNKCTRGQVVTFLYRAVQ